MICAGTRKSLILGSHLHTLCAASSCIPQPVAHALLNPLVPAVSLHAVGVAQVLSPSRDRCLGCVYINPPTKAGYAAEVLLWAVSHGVSNEVAAHLDEALEQAVREWIGTTLSPSSMYIFIVSGCKRTPASHDARSHAGAGCSFVLASASFSQPNEARASNVRGKQRGL